MKVERKPKFYIFLIEILWGILFFALSSIVCVNFFVKSNQLSQEAVKKNKAMLIGESVAEEMRTNNVELSGFELIENNHYQQKKDDYLIDVMTTPLELNYEKHHIVISQAGETLVEFEVMSGGY
ncbi:hypothetical protein [Anaerorhabdus sp.]|uniref:hypothetical protein n=1 Tax=Anaerorhabdus sp. TaxID=1872524 RepID=UPI002FC5F1CB